jgi:filamentous hemagglutinin family protein
MKYFFPFRKFFNARRLFLFVALCAAAQNENLFANPTGMTVVSGSASAQQNGSQLNVTTSAAAFLNWSSFNIQQGETTTFIQPSVNSVVLNEIGGANPSQIFGNLNANGTVILANANGFYFGPNSMISVDGSFIATTAPLAPDFGAGSAWTFTGMPPLANIVNYGQIQVGSGKSLFLIAEQIENHGELNAPGGDVGLYAGENILISDRPDGRGLSATVQVPSGSINNFGQITADAGTIALQAKVVNQDGLIQADSIQNRNGVIELVASDSIALGANSQILANGDNSSSGSDGGQIMVQSVQTFSDVSGSQIEARGGANGGDGGRILIYTDTTQSSVNSSLDVSAQNGSSGSIYYYPIVDGDLTVTADSFLPFVGFSRILFQANGSITLADQTLFDLSGSIGVSDGQLMLEAGNNIIFGDGSEIFDANNWSVNLFAGVDFTSPTLKVVPVPIGNTDPTVNHSIYLNGGDGQSGSGTIQTFSGSIDMTAGQDIQVGSGSVSTTGGGSIFVNALSGDINAGTDNGSSDGQQQSTDYNFTDGGWTPNPFLGGISTAAGGSVTLIAGDNIDSTPTVPTREVPGASGAYGVGDVTVIAGNQITGNYTVTDGTGRMIAGVPVSVAQSAVLQNPSADPSSYTTTLNDLVTAVEQSQNSAGNIGAAPVNGKPSTAPVTLGLTSGSWNAWAANDISIKQVINPNGAFNDGQSFAYNYAPDAAVNLWAGNAIELVGGSFGSAPSSVGSTPIYAPTLSLNAGGGGIKIDKNIILAPSLYTDPVTGNTYSEGALSIVTREGGNLSGAVVSGSTVLNGITISDSASGDYTTFNAEHDNIHLNDPNPQPVYLDISGSIGSFSLTVPTFADITVESTKPFVTPDGSDISEVYGAYNFGFRGRNLSASQTTSINVLGDIVYRGILTTHDLTDAELDDPLPALMFSDSADTLITSKLTFDPVTKKLTYVGVMSASDLAFLLNPQIIVLDVHGNPVLQPLLDDDGNPVLDANGNPEMVPVTKPLVLDDTQQAMITQLDTASQSASLGDQGLSLAGLGTFNVTANTMDLGVSGGIHVLVPDAGLTAISPYGANLNVTTLGDLTMTSTKISNESYLGNVNVNVGGTLDAGGQLTTLGDASDPKGIYTTSGGNVSVTASGDVNVDGSRIAAYDGGNIFVESLNGDVNAGAGGAGYVTMSALQLNPSGQLFGVLATIPGSGILATTVVGSDALLGNITVNAPNGGINASLGGILQIGFNGHGPSDAFISANAGQDIDAQGSGIIGSNIKLQAGGDINGLVIGSGSVDINSAQNVDVTAFSGGDVSINAGGEVSGTVISGGNVDVSGDSITASLIASSVSTSGDASGATEGIPQSNVAKDNAQTADDATTVASKTDSDDDDLKKKNKGIALAQKVSRVTVILPKKN